MHLYNRITAASLQALTHLAHQLHQNPAETPGYVLRLYPIALERAALLHAIHYEEDFELNTTEMLFNHEMKQIEDDFDKSRTRLRERVLEGLEERRRRAREEKEGEGVVSVGMCPISQFKTGRVIRPYSPHLSFTHSILTLTLSLYFFYNPPFTLIRIRAGSNSKCTQPLWAQFNSHTTTIHTRPHYPIRSLTRRPNIALPTLSYLHHTLQPLPPPSPEWTREEAARRWRTRERSFVWCSSTCAGQGDWAAEWV